MNHQLVGLNKKKINKTNANDKIVIMNRHISCFEFNATQLSELSVDFYKKYDVLLKFAPDDKSQSSAHIKKILNKYFENISQSKNTTDIPIY